MGKTLGQKEIGILNGLKSLVGRFLKDLNAIPCLGTMALTKIIQNLQANIVNYVVQHKTEFLISETCNQQYSIV